MNLTDFRPSPLKGKLPEDLERLYWEVCGHPLPPTVRTLRDVWWSIVVDGLRGRFLERIRDLKVEAYHQERSPQILNPRFIQEARRLWKNYSADAESSGDRIEATRRFLSAIQAMTLPKPSRSTTENPALEQKRRKDTQRAFHATARKAADLEKKLRASLEREARKAAQRPPKNFT